MIILWMGEKSPANDKNWRSTSYRTFGKQGREFLQAFIQHCISGKNYVTGETGTPLDFITFHAKGSPKVVDGMSEWTWEDNLGIFTAVLRLQLIILHLKISLSLSENPIRKAVPHAAWRQILKMLIAMAPCIPVILLLHLQENMPSQIPGVSIFLVRFPGLLNLKISPGSRVQRSGDQWG